MRYSISENKGQEQRVEESNLTSKRKKKILFVNDDYDTTDVMKQSLSRYEFEVQAFVDPKASLRNFRPGEYDLLLPDVLMKELDGVELYYEIKKRDEQIRVCFISASNTFYEKYKDHFPEIEKECFIEKPISISIKDLADMIESIIVS